MKTLGVIPARFASTRFPGKPLVDIAGMTMVQRVYTQSCKATGLGEVVVATDDARIHEHVLGFGGKSLMTSSHHLSGTDRIIEVASLMPDFDAYINIQGDEPFIDPRQIDQVVEIMRQQPGPCVATLAKRIDDEGLLHNPNAVKVVFGFSGRAIYFSRSPIPYLRDHGMAEEWRQTRGYFKHIGIYGYANGALGEIANMSCGMLERAESLEQLRWMEHGMDIFVGLTEFEPHTVDTPQDLEAVRAMIDR